MCIIYIVSVLSKGNLTCETAGCFLAWGRNRTGILSMPVSTLRGCPCFETLSVSGHGCTSLSQVQKVLCVSDKSWLGLCHGIAFTEAGKLWTLSWNFHSMTIHPLLSCLCQWCALAPTVCGMVHKELDSDVQHKLVEAKQCLSLLCQRGWTWILTLKVLQELDGSGLSPALLHWSWCVMSSSDFNTLMWWLQNLNVPFSEGDTLKFSLDCWTSWMVTPSMCAFQWLPYVTGAYAKVCIKCQVGWSPSLHCWKGVLNWVLWTREALPPSHLEGL